MPSRRSNTVLFSSVVDKINRKHKYQERVLVVTDDFILNVSKDLSKVKRVIPRERVNAVTVALHCHRFVLHVQKEYDYYFHSTRLKQFLDSACAHNVIIREVGAEIQDLSAFVTSKGEGFKMEASSPPRRQTFFSTSESKAPVRRPTWARDAVYKKESVMIDPQSRPTAGVMPSLDVVRAIKAGTTVSVRVSMCFCDVISQSKHIVVVLFCEDTPESGNYVQPIAHMEANSWQPPSSKEEAAVLYFDETFRVGSLCDRSLKLSVMLAHSEDDVLRNPTWLGCTPPILVTELISGPLSVHSVDIQADDYYRGSISLYTTPVCRISDVVCFHICLEDPGTQHSIFDLGGVLGKHSKFLVRIFYKHSSGTFLPVHTTRPSNEKTAMASWDPVIIKFSELCLADWHCDLKFEVVHGAKTARVVGSVQTTMAELQNVSRFQFGSGGHIVIRAQHIVIDEPVTKLSSEATQPHSASQHRPPPPLRHRRANSSSSSDGDGFEGEAEARAGREDPPAPAHTEEGEDGGDSEPVLCCAESSISKHDLETMLSARGDTLVFGA